MVKTTAGFLEAFGRADLVPQIASHANEPIDELFLEVCRQHPEHDIETARARAMARHICLSQVPEPVVPVAPLPAGGPPIVTPQPERHKRGFWRWIEVAILGALLGILGVQSAHCQGIQVVHIQDNGTTRGTAAGPFTLDFASNLSVSKSGTTYTIDASSTASTAFSALTAGTNSNAGTFAASGNTWNFSAATALLLPTSSGCTTASAGQVCYDSNAKEWRVYIGSSDDYLIPSSNVGSSGYFNVSNGDGTATYRAVATTDLPSSVVTSITNDTNVTGSISAQALTLGRTGTLAVARGGTGASSTSQNYFFAGPTSGSGAPAFRAIVAGDIPTLNYQATLSTHAATTHYFLTGFTSPNTFTDAQPACGDLSNAAASCSTDATDATNITSGTLPFAQLPSLPWVCNGPGLGDGLNAMAAGTYLQTNCYNGTGHTVTITGIKCYTDNNGTSTMNVSDNSANDLLTSAVTCTNSYATGTQSTTTTLANGAWVKFTFVADGTTKETSWLITGTY